MKKIILLIGIYAFISCGKKLDLKPESSIVLPQTAQDLQFLLDNTDVFNITPAFPQISADEYFIPDLQAWESLRYATARNAYVWNKGIYAGETSILEWRYPYSAIFYANNVLDVLNSKDISNNTELKVLKGWALFARAYSFYCVVSTFSKAYNPPTADTDLGIPLKLNAGVDEIVPRSSVQRTYEQIIKDALESSELLQQNIISGKRNRPSKVAAYALLGRVYLSMRQYDKAELYAGKALDIYSTLTDFNTLDKTAVIPFTFDAEEVIYFSRIANTYSEITGALLRTGYGIDPQLLSLYDPSDLRLFIYFQKNTLGNYNMKMINSISNSPFNGLATDEVYLIKAECLARRGEKEQALDYLNQLVSKRWDPTATGVVKPYPIITAASPEAALDEVLKERRKSLVFRSVRWTDLKRLNLEERNITITRKLGDRVFTLEPNSPRYVLPIPDDEVLLSGVEQNIR